MFCTSCNKQLFGGETFCPYCGGRIQPPQPTAAQAGGMPLAPNAKPGLRGFAKGWTIFTVVLYSAYIAQNLTNLTNPSMSDLLLPALILLGLMDFGAVLMLKMKPYGFYIQLGAALLYLTLSGASNGRYMISTSGSIVVFVSWIATKKQLDYAIWKNRTNQFILLEGFAKSWTIFILGYMTPSVISNLMNLGNHFRNPYSNPYSLSYLLCGAGVILGAAIILNKRGWGILIMLASIIARMITVDSQMYGNVFKMNDAEINRFGLTVILSLAPALLTWIFTHKQIHFGFGTKSIVPSPGVPFSGDFQLPPKAPQPAPQEAPQPAPAEALPQEPEKKPRPADASAEMNKEIEMEESITMNETNIEKSAVSLESFNSPVFKYSGGEYIGTNQEWVKKIKQESRDAIAWFNAQNFVPIPALGLKIEAEYCFDMALQAQNAGIIKEAWVGFHQALQRYCRLNDSKMIARSCFNLGKVYGVNKNWELAMLMFLHSVYITKKLGDQKGFAWSVFYLGDVMSNLGDKVTAKRFLTEALPVFQQVLPDDVAGVETCIRRLT